MGISSLFGIKNMVDYFVVLFIATVLIGYLHFTIETCILD